MRTHPMQISKDSASKLHKIGEKLREEDKHEEALVYLTLAINKYINNKKYERVVDCLQSRFLTWKHLFLLSKDPVVFEIALKDAQTSLTICEKLKIRDLYSKCSFRMGEACMLENNYKGAIDYYSKALRFFKGFLSEKGDYRYHLGEALYRTGNKDEGYRAMLQGMSEIERGKGGVDSFLYNVWKTGCLMRMAELLRIDKPIMAKKYMRFAGNIIIKDKRLIIRKRQFEELKKIF